MSLCSDQIFRSQKNSFIRRVSVRPRSPEMFWWDWAADGPRRCAPSGNYIHTDTDTERVRECHSTHWPLVDQSITAHNSTDLKLNSTYHLFKTNYTKYKLGKYIKLCSNVILVWLILNNNYTIIVFCSFKLILFSLSFIICVILFNIQ